MPAVGLGVRPPSIISTSTDEGGFNEPSPEVKAKLKPAYTFELDPSVVVQQEQQPDLHYVDVSHRLNPDGSEGENSYIEPEMYSIKNTMMMDLEMSSPASRGAEKVVYATIKPEVPPPPTDLYNEAENGSAFYGGDEDSSLYVSTVYHSPQTILDPTRPTLSNGGSRQDSIEDKRLPDLPTEPTPPPRPPLPKGPPLDVTDDVEYVDASDDEVQTPTAKRVNGLLNGSKAAEEDEVAIPESMTADEAERLLSSR